MSLSSTGPQNQAMAPSPDHQEYLARWVFPGDAPPIPWGRVVVEQGRIVSIDQHSARPEAKLLPECALLPGLVNAHTHLEFSDLSRPMGDAGGSFARWLRDVIAVRRQEAEQRGATPDVVKAEKSAAVAQGEEESRSHHVRLLGEIATPGGPQEHWQSQSSLDNVSDPLPLQVIAFLELLGLSPERQPALLELAEQYLASMASRNQSGRILPGLSPHAPYTIGIDFLSQLCQLAAKYNVPVAMHLAESWEELELLQSHSGELTELLRVLGAWYPGAVPRGLTPHDFLEVLATAPRALVVHGNFLGTEDWKFLAEHRDRMSVVYCPRTHAYFSHGPYPLREMLTNGVRVALGTDSRASNPNLSLWEEMQYVARQHPQVSAEEVLRAGTLSGAEGLGLERDFGTISVGKVGALTMVHGGPHWAELVDPAAALAALLSQGEIARGC
ncbi:MAG: amidohydrolase family protein [Planctomycetaceae bacterium]